jgi:hypothetical protein
VEARLQARRLLEEGSGPRQAGLVVASHQGQGFLADAERPLVEGRRRRGRGRRQSQRAEE